MRDQVKGKVSVGIRDLDIQMRKMMMIHLMVLQIMGKIIHCRLLNIEILLMDYSGKNIIIIMMIMMKDHLIWKLASKKLNMKKEDLEELVNKKMKKNINASFMKKRKRKKLEDDY